MAPFGSTARNKIGERRKSTNKNPDQSEHFYRARMESDAAKLAAIMAAKSPATAQAKRTSHSSCVELEQDDEAEKEQKNFGDQRVVIKFFYEHFNSPPEAEWKGVHGTISRIRSRMGDAAPCKETVFRTLTRLADGDEDITSKPGGGGGQSKMSADEDVLVGLLACRGFSQPMALQYLNLQRYERDPGAAESAPSGPWCFILRPKQLQRSSGSRLMRR